MKRIIFAICLLLPFALKAQYCGPYTATAPISLDGVTTPTVISGDSINCLNAMGTIGIYLHNCSNIHITKCKFINVQSFAIDLENCTNITVDTCNYSSVGMGVYAHNSTTIKVNANQILNVNGIDASYFGHAIQFDNVSGGGNQINFNRIMNDSTVAIKPHDQISVFQSTGLPGDSIQVIGNYIRGGQIALDSARDNGACGITLADISGSYQVARYNYMVDPGYGGIQSIGSSATGIKIDHNFVYSKRTNISLIGLSVQIASGSGINVSYNTINWTTHNGTIQNLFNTGVVPIGWSTNSPNTYADPGANDTMIPNPLWAACSIIYVGVIPVFNVNVH